MKNKEVIIEVYYGTFKVWLSTYYQHDKDTAIVWEWLKREAPGYARFNQFGTTFVVHEHWSDEKLFSISDETCGANVVMNKGFKSVADALHAWKEERGKTLTVEVVTLAKLEFVKKYKPKYKPLCIGSQGY